MVALLSMLIAADNGFQSVMMAPAEILAQQHYNSISTYLDGLPVQVGLLTGSTPVRGNVIILQSAEDGTMQILIGTHAIIEDKKFSLKTSALPSLMNNINSGGGAKGAIVEEEQSAAPYPGHDGQTHSPYAGLDRLWRPGLQCH